MTGPCRGESLGSVNVPSKIRPKGRRISWDMPSASNTGPLFPVLLIVVDGLGANGITDVADVDACRARQVFNR